MRTQIIGTRNNVRWPAPGETVDLPDDEGARMCARGFAEPVAEVVVAETRPVAVKRTEKRKG